MHSHCGGGSWLGGCGGVAAAVDAAALDDGCAGGGPRVWFAMTSSNSSDLRKMISIFGFCTALSRPSSLKASSPVVISAEAEYDSAYIIPQTSKHMLHLRLVSWINKTVTKTFWGMGMHLMHHQLQTTPS